MILSYYDHLPFQVVTPYKYAEDWSSASHTPTSIKAYSNFDQSMSEKNGMYNIIINNFYTSMMFFIIVTIS